MKPRPKVLVTTVPFGELDGRPLEMLAQAGLEVVLNPMNRKLTAEDLAGLISGVDFLIAGTEEINETVLNCADSLRLIARVGIGLDSVDLRGTRERGIPVTYTPDAPSEAVADLTVGLMLSCLRQIHVANERMHSGQWHRYFGRRLGLLTIGLIGLGRIGSRVARRLDGFGPRAILGHDLLSRDRLEIPESVQLVDLERLVHESDVISLHIPLSTKTKGMFDSTRLRAMKPDAVLVNTSRGGVIVEADLLDVLSDGHLAAAALDVFDLEPYRGPLEQQSRVLLTSHMGSMSVDSRTNMEVEAVEEVVRMVKGLPLIRQVPEFEYE